MSAIRGQQLDRLIRSLTAAQQVASFWADGVRFDAECRLGIDAGDIAALEDAEYNQVLDVFNMISLALAGAKEIQQGRRP